ERVRELTTLRAEQRLALAVLRLAAQAGRETAGGHTIGLPLRRRDVAEFSGTTLYTASRALAAWQKAGLLATCRGQLTICDASGLRRIAGDG
ncbi:MAG: winged helix-turn-helix domain-containing protein, partial [Steroidobacteraceae bacterium]|nr:winged helix-turn-helix domain-containing protein [Steroidobacteraceae bacterium]